MAHKKKYAGRWRRRFLSALARTANARLAAEMSGVDHTTAYQLRGRDPGFAADWLRARGWGRARVKAEGRPVFPGGRPRPARPGEAPPDPRPLIVRRSKREGSQIVRAGEGRWSPESEEDFFAYLVAGFGVRYSARAVGFSTVALYKRRAADPDFKARWDGAREEGRARNDALMIDAVPLALDPAVIEAAEDLPRPTIAEAIQIVRMYQPPPQGAAERRRLGSEPPRRSAKEIFDELAARVAEVKQEEAQKRLAQGWTQDEAGNWIPPGWVRKAG
jgi:hypothetical protein